MPIRARSSQAWFDGEHAGREPAEGGVFVGADAVFDAGAAAVAGFEVLD
jgi:hypothetical protein